MKERDHIGFDPVRWIDRLRAVNAGSQFKEREKAHIEVALEKLERELRDMAK